MSAQANVQLVKNLFAAMDSGDLEAVQALTADDIEWVVPGEWALAGNHRGHAGLVDFFQMAANTVETAIAQPLEFIAQGNRVQPLATARGKSRLRTRRSRTTLFSLTVSDGKVTHIREYIDTLALARASGMAASHPS
jgi:ketosteroid isomerase-like protein